MAHLVLRFITNAVIWVGIGSIVVIVIGLSDAASIVDSTGVDGFVLFNVRFGRAAVTIAGLETRRGVNEDDARVVAVGLGLGHADVGLGVVGLGSGAGPGSRASEATRIRRELSSSGCHCKWIAASPSLTFDSLS